MRRRFGPTLIIVVLTLMGQIGHDATSPGEHTEYASQDGGHRSEAGWAG